MKKEISRLYISSYERSMLPVSGKSPGPEKVGSPSNQAIKVLVVRIEIEKKPSLMIDANVHVRKCQETG